MIKNINIKNKMELAIQEAHKSPMKSKYGAVLIHRHKIIASGYNDYIKRSSINKNCPLCATSLFHSC
jgi:deoxycytidylate deaminase